MAGKTKESSGQTRPDAAAKNAMRYLAGFVPGASDVRIEEVELSDDERFWLITLSFSPPDHPFSMQREYKLFKVDASSGEVKSMKIRQV